MLDVINRIYSDWGDKFTNESDLIMEAGMDEHISALQLCNSLNKTKKI